MDRVRQLSAQIAPVPTEGKSKVDGEKDPFPGPSPAGKIVIYGQPTSRVQKVLWMCEEVGVPYEQVVMMAERFQPWYDALNPKNTVPTIKDGDVVVNESNTIVSYIANKYGKAKGLYPEDPAKLAMAWQWLEFGEDTLAPKLGPIFFPKVRKIYYAATDFGKKGAPPEAEIAERVPACVKAFSTLEKQLAKSTYVLGDSFTMADITVSIHTNRLLGNDGFGFAELAPAKFPNIVRHWNLMKQRKGFAHADHK